MQKVSTQPWLPGSLESEYRAQYPRKQVLPTKAGNPAKSIQAHSVPFTATSTSREDFKVRNWAACAVKACSASGVVHRSVPCSHYHTYVAQPLKTLRSHGRRGSSIRKAHMERTIAKNRRPKSGSKDTVNIGHTTWTPMTMESMASRTTRCEVSTHLEYCTKLHSL